MVLVWLVGARVGRNKFVLQKSGLCILILLMISVWQAWKLVVVSTPMSWSASQPWKNLKTGCISLSLSGVTFKEIFVRSLDDYRDNRRETSMNTYNKKYTLCNTIWKSHKGSLQPSTSKTQQSLINGRIRFPELPQHDAQNVHFSTENYNTYKEIEKYVPSTENRVWQKWSLEKPRN